VCCGGFQRWALMELPNRDAGGLLFVFACMRTYRQAGTYTLGFCSNAYWCRRTRLRSATRDFSIPWGFSLVTTQQLVPNRSPLDPRFPRAPGNGQSGSFLADSRKRSPACPPRREAHDCAAFLQHHLHLSSTSTTTGRITLLVLDWLLSRAQSTRSRASRMPENVLATGGA
jgi:hypothetical protein